MGLKNAILENLSKRRLVCLKQETSYVAGWIGTFHFFIRTLAPARQAKRIVDLFRNYSLVATVKITKTFNSTVGKTEKELMLIAQPDGCSYLLSAGTHDLLARPLPPKRDISLIYIEFVGRRIIRHVNKR